jgi:hypothetical protein
MHGDGHAALVCIMMQMLGVPVTLLNPLEAADTLAASALEGFSVAPFLPQLTSSSEAVPVTDAHPSVDVLVLASALCRAPILQFRFLAPQHSGTFSARKSVHSRLHWYSKERWC